MRRGQGRQDSCKSACLKIFVMNEKDPIGRECNDSEPECERNVWASTGGSQDHGHTYKARLCAHQPVPWKGINVNVERGAEESFLPDEQRQIYNRDIGVVKP
jgi:hypothetical protein